MTGCSAKGCRNSTVKGFVVKRFPRDPARRDAWAANVKREGWTPTNASCLCEVHFDDDQWENHDWGGTPKLKRTAVPTLFCNCSYGKKRVKNAGQLKTANAHVMTEHSYGSVQGTENSQPSNMPVQNSKGKFDRRSDHQYAISAEEEDKKKAVVSDESKKENSDHTFSCPLYNRRARKTLSFMDRNNNGNQRSPDPVGETLYSNVEAVLSTVEDAGLKKEVFHSQNSEQNICLVNQPRKEVAILQVNTPLNIGPSVTEGAELITPKGPQILLLIPEHQSIKTNDGSSAKTKADTVMTGNITKRTNYIQLLSNNSQGCNCKKESVDTSKIKAAEKVLAKQGRLVKQVATLQRQLIRQKHTHDLEIEKLLKKFRDLEEKFDLTRSILRSCVGDDQLTVCATENSRGVVWSKKTIQKALQLRSSCGAAGYNSISKLLIPLPSERTLQRWNQRSKSHDGVYVEVPKGAFTE